MNIIDENESKIINDDNNNIQKFKTEDQEKSSHQHHHPSVIARTGTSDEISNNVKPSSNHSSSLPPQTSVDNDFHYRACKDLFICFILLNHRQFRQKSFRSNLLEKLELSFSLSIFIFQYICKKILKTVPKKSLNFILAVIKEAKDNSDNPVKFLFNLYLIVANSSNYKLLLFYCNEF